MKVDGSQRKTAKLNGLNFSYLEWGAESSPPMIMLHGIQSHAHSWDVFANALQDEHRILAMDQRGHGDTDWPEQDRRDRKWVKPGKARDRLPEVFHKALQSACDQINT